MDNVHKMQEMLAQLQVPQKQQSLLCAYVLLAMAGLKENNLWSKATNDWVRIHDLIEFISVNYAKVYAENSRETFRKQAIHHFRTAAFIEDNGQPSNYSANPNHAFFFR